MLGIFTGEIYRSLRDTGSEDGIRYSVEKSDDLDDTWKMAAEPGRNEAGLTTATEEGNGLITIPRSRRQDESSAFAET